MVWKVTESEFSEIFLSELAAVIESSSTCRRGKVVIPVLVNLLKLVAAKSTRVSEIVKELMEAYRECFGTINRCRKQSTMRVRILSKFHSVRLSKLSLVWKKIFLKLADCHDHDPLWPQTINRRVMNRLILKHFSSSTNQASGDNSQQHIQMRAEDENVLCYVSGYVSLKLMRRFEKQSGTKARQFVECLSKMAVMGKESSFFDYTKEWLKLVNRGGLFQVNEPTYLFYRAVEVKTRVYLPQHLSKPHGGKGTLISSIKDDSAVQNRWTSLIGAIDEDNDAQELLGTIIELWITIRGHSLTATWFEDYKKATKKSVKKSKRLRKSIKEYSDDKE